MTKRKGDGRRNNQPPVSGQFKPGQSGNPRGRQKGSYNRRKVLEDELDKTVVVAENGRQFRKRKWDVMIAQQVNKATASDLKATQFVTEQMFRYGLLNHVADNEPAKLGPDAQSVFDEFARRLRAAQPLDQSSDAAANETLPSTPSTDKDEQS